MNSTKMKKLNLFDNELRFKAHPVVEFSMKVDTKSTFAL